MTSFAGIKEAYIKTSLLQKNNLMVLTKKSVHPRNLFHRIEREISELCSIIKSWILRKYDLNNIETSYKNDLIQVMNYIKLHKELDIKTIPNNLPNKDELLKEINNHPNKNQRDEIYEIFFQLSKPKYIYPIYFAQTNQEIHKNKTAPDGYIIHTKKGIYLIDSKLNINKNSLILSKYDIFSLFFKDHLKTKENILNKITKTTEKINDITVKLDTIYKIIPHQNKSLFNNELSKIKLNSEKIDLEYNKNSNTEKLKQYEEQLKRVNSLLTPAL